MQSQLVFIYEIIFFLLLLLHNLSSKDASNFYNDSLPENLLKHGNIYSRTNIHIIVHEKKHIESQPNEPS